MAPKKTYAVRRGRETGLFKTWAECQKQVIGFSGAEYKSFITLKEAEAYIEGASEEVVGEDFTTDDGNQSVEVVVAYVDGSYDVKTHQYGSGVVILWKGEKQVFSFKGDTPQLADMRNVAGEIVGAQRAMEFALENKAKKVIIYYDYEGIEKWCTGAWKAKKEGTQMYAQAYERLKKQIEVEFVKVRAHTGDKYNEEADILAKKAIDLL
ncbi:MAG TPA: reverse transcriptase-like protein [Epulopiscium sp.]|nr:reverse transcriptase-like protein [Candidatus Epulonipiscium sp.]